MTRVRRLALVLDEMFPPAIADELRRCGHDVVAVAADPQLRAMTDERLCRWAVERERRIVTENAKDFRRLIAATEGPPTLLLTSSRPSPRSRRHPGPLIAALDAWLNDAARSDRSAEDWLQPAPVET